MMVKRKLDGAVFSGLRNSKIWRDCTLTGKYLEAWNPVLRQAGWLAGKQFGRRNLREA